MSTLFCFGKSRIGIRSKRHHQILNDHSSKGPLIRACWLHTRTSDLNRYVTEVTSINDHHSFFKIPISTEQFQSLFHCKCEANSNTNILISGPTRATFNFIRKTKCWRAWHHVNWTSSACIYLHHYQIITTWILMMRSLCASIDFVDWWNTSHAWSRLLWTQFSQHKIVINTWQDCYDKSVLIRYELCFTLRFVPFTW